jgi:hypothetical protein
MKKLITAILMIGVLITGMLTAVAQPAIQPGHVEILQLRSTLWGIQQAALGRPDTMLLMKDQTVVFMWVVKDAWAFIGINTASTPSAVDFAGVLKEANLVNAKEMKDVADFLKKLGYQQVTPDKLPPAVLSAAAQGTGWLAHMASNLVTVLVIPVGVFTLPEEYQKYEG